MMLAMTALAARIRTPVGVSSRALPAVLSVAALCLLAVLLALATDKLSVSLPLVVAGGALLCALTVFAIQRFDSAVLLGLALMGFVRFQPAPTDAVFAVVMVIAALTGRFRLSRVPVLIRLVVGLTLCLQLASFVDVVELKEALQFFFITAYLMIFAVWMAGYLDSEHKARVLVLTWLWVGVVSAIVSVASLLLPLPGRSFILGGLDGGVRASGLFKDPNVFGPFLIPIAVILLEQRIGLSRIKLLHLRNSSSLVILGVLTAGILFSWSRASWGNYCIAITVMLAISSVRHRGSRRTLRAVAMLFGALSIVTVVVAASGSLSFIEHRAKLQSYDSKRFAAQSFGWETGWKHPLGVGPGQFKYYSPIEVHSAYLDTMSQSGPLGLVLWLALVIATLAIGLRSALLGRDLYGIGSAALLGAWCGLVFNSAVVDTMHWRHLWLVAALIWATAARPGGMSLARERTRVGLPRRAPASA